VLLLAHPRAPLREVVRGPASADVVAFDLRSHDGQSLPQRQLPLPFEEALAQRRVRARGNGNLSTLEIPRSKKQLTTFDTLSSRPTNSSWYRNCTALNG